jgi:Tetracyclin repressor-like, C-terminal domain
VAVSAVLTFLRCWTVLYGAVSMEVFGHMSFALTDPATMFEITLGDLAALVGLRYPAAPLTVARDVHGTQRSSGRRSGHASTRKFFMNA